MKNSYEENMQMNKEWSDRNKTIQKLLGKETTYKEGIDLLIEFRSELFEQITQIVNGYPREAFYQMPFAGADGYHSKTLAYSIWHIFRIEDIVAHTLIQCDEQILFSKGYREKIGCDIITTGNELEGERLKEFSKKLDVDSLYAYAKDVMMSTNEMLQKLDYQQMKRCFGDEDSKMPFSRHWIMHIEAMQRIKNKLCKLARKGVDPIAYCGLSCNHCFLGQWCGSCRTAYNVCSFATCMPDKKCPNAACCQNKNIDGCYECEEIETCTKGFYTPENDGANAAKAQAMFIKKYGKKAFLSVHDKLHEKYDFAKTQEILGQDMYEGLALLEETYRS